MKKKIIPKKNGIINGKSNGKNKNKLFKKYKHKNQKQLKLSLQFTKLNNRNRKSIPNA